MYTNDRRIEYNMCRQIMKKMYGYPNIMKKVGKKNKRQMLYNVKISWNALNNCFISK